MIATVGYLFHLQYVCDMKVTYPRCETVDDPMKVAFGPQVCLAGVQPPR